MCFFRRKGPPTGFCIEKRHRSGVSTSKELVRDKNMRCHFWMDGKNWMVQVMVNEWIEWYHHVTSWSYIRSSSNLHSTAPFLLKMAQAWECCGEKNLTYLLEKPDISPPPCLDGSFGGELRSLSSQKERVQNSKGESIRERGEFICFFLVQLLWTSISHITSNNMFCAGVGTSTSPFFVANHSHNSCLWTSCFFCGWHGYGFSASFCYTLKYMA